MASWAGKMLKWVWYTRRCSVVASEVWQDRKESGHISWGSSLRLWWLKVLKGNKQHVHVAPQRSTATSLPHSGQADHRAAVKVARSHLGTLRNSGSSLSLGRSTVDLSSDYLKVLVQDLTVVAAFREPAIWNGLSFQPLDDATAELITVSLIADHCREGRGM